MTLDIIAPAFYPDTSYVEYFLQSAIRHKVPVNLYGLTQPFTHWMDTHVHRCIEVIEGLQSSHVLFTDTSDVIFLAGVDEITQKYEAMGSPPALFSVERSGVNGGQWIGERTVMLDILGFLAHFGTSGDPQVRIREAIGQGLLTIEGDTKRQLFQVMDDSDARMRNGRIYNIDTGTYPSLAHFAGGYTDHVHGKREQMQPMCRILGYE